MGHPEYKRLLESLAELQARQRAERREARERAYRVPATRGGVWNPTGLAEAEARPLWRRPNEIAPAVLRENALNGNARPKTGRSGPPFDV